MRTLCQKSGSVGLEAHRAQVVARREANVGVEGSSETAEHPTGVVSRSSRLPLVGLFRRAAVFALASLLGAETQCTWPPG
jgi:hypothetical protein